MSSLDEFMVILIVVISAISISDNYFRLEAFKSSPEHEKIKRLSSMNYSDVKQKGKADWIIYHGYKNFLFYVSN